MTGVYLVYVCHINSAGLFLFFCTLPGLPGLITAAGRFRLGLFADPFCLGHQKTTNSRLMPAKDPHPGVDIIYMVAPLHRGHTQIRRPASVNAGTCKER
jgi:hypothetical protein